MALEKEIIELIARIEAYVDRFQERHKIISEKAIERELRKDYKMAMMYKNELMEIRKIIKQLLFVQATLERLLVNVELMQTGCCYNNAIPVIAVLKEVKEKLRPVMPELSFKIAELQQALEEIVITASEFTGVKVDFNVTSPEAKKILEEAEIQAEKWLREYINV